MAKRPAQAKSAKSAKNSEHAAQLATEKKNRDKYLADLAKARDKELRAFLKASRGTGIYDVKRPEGVSFAKMPLSRHQRYRASKAMKEFGDFFDPTKFTLLIPEKKGRKVVKQRADALGLKSTKLGFFAPREGYQRVTLGKDAKRGEYFIRRSGKTKRGVNKGKRYSKITPLASVDDLDGETDRLIHMAKKLGPLKDNQRLAFEVREQGNEGYSHSTFTDIGHLIDYLNSYQKSVEARVQFFRHVHIVKTASFRTWANEHPVKARVGSYGRSIYARTKLDKAIRKKNG